MPDGATYIDSPQARGGGRAGAGDVLFTNAESFVAAARAKCVATLGELTSAPEVLSEGRTLTDLTPPYMVLNLNDGVDVSPDYAVFDEATSIQVEFIYVTKTLRSGLIDNTQALRPRLTLLEQAFLADRTLGGLVTRTEVVHTAANRANQYQTMFQQQGQSITVSVLTMEFHLVTSVATLYT